MMHRFLIISFALGIFISAVGAAPAAYAADCTVDTIGQSCTTTGGGTGTCVQTEIGVACSASGAPEAVSDGTKNPTPYKADSTDSAYGLIMTKIMTLFAWLVGVAAITLNYAAYYTVVRMGEYVNQLSAIGVAWRIIRDLSNILLIFGFLGAGIMTILNTELYGWSSKMLPKLLIVAIGINFSLFISEAMIDGTNLVATQVYAQINGNTIPIPSTLTTANEGISNKIMNQLGLQTIYGNGTVNTKIFEGGNPWIVGFMGILLFIVTAFVMFSLAFILIARFVVLIFLILVSPLAVIGWGVPWLEYRFDQWWKNFLEQIVTAPVLFLLLYVALAVITDAQFLTGFGGKPDWTGYITGSSGGIAGFASTVLSFLVAMGLLMVVVIKAKSMGAVGAAGATKFAGKLTFGATAWAGRRTVGRMSNYAARGIRTSRIGGTKTGRLLATTFDRGAKGSFDMRGTKLMGNLKPYTDLGTPQKGGYKAQRDATIKGHQDYIKSVGEAIDERGATKAEEAAITRAEEAQKNAKSAYAIAEREYKAAQARLDPEIALQKAEVARLQEEQKANMERNGLPDPDTEERLRVAEQKLKETEANLAVEKKEYDAAGAELGKAEKAVIAAGKESGDRISGEKKKAQVAYAENIASSLIGSVVFGPGGAVAAKKIIKDSKKNPDKELLSKLRKAMDAQGKEEKGEEEKKEEGKEEGKEEKSEEAKK